ncbi:hypothetical protein M0R72_07035 [Candidatus Pacearchaeota archaeon]|jgi:hypothetical protein|nr:hypothetical protein [Candidatus Pacearchaeota archaeon]
MSKHFCRVCGIRLYRENAYKNRKSGHGYRRLCKECDKERRNANNAKSGKMSRLQLKGKYRKITISFQSPEAKKHFLLYRRQQVIGCHPKVGNESKVGQRVEHLVEKQDKHGETHRWFESTKCDECGGEVRFKENGFKRCIECGLLSSNYTLSNELDEPQKRDIPQEEYYSYARQDISSEEESA